MITVGRTLMARLGSGGPIRRDLALALVLWVVLLLDSAGRPHGPHVSALGMAAGLVGTLPLALRSRAPVPVAAVLTLATVLVLATLGADDVVALPTVFALYTVAATGARGRSLLAAGVVTAAAVAIVTMFSQASEVVGIAAQNVALLLAGLAVGDAVRWREAYQASMREHVASKVAEERLRIARDLHDSVAHAMTAINVQAGAAAHLIERRPDAAREALAEIRRVSGEAIADLRGTLGQLRDGGIAPLRPAPSLDGLDDLVERVRAAGVEVSLEVQGTSSHIPAGVDAAAHRIVQEALTNVLRHSHARAAAVSVVVNGSSVVLDVSDDGDGTTVASPAPDPHAAGFGLVGMRERALSVGGSVSAGPRPGGGWRVHARLPLVAR